MNNFLVSLLFIFICLSCTHNSETEKYQRKRNNIIKVQEQIKEIMTEDALIGRENYLYIMNNYLIISSPKNVENVIHLFNKKDFQYIMSFGSIGQGPGEIANMGAIGINEAERLFYVSDHGKQKIVSYSLDSVLINTSYMPEEKMKMNENYFPSRYKYINDTLCVGLVIEPIGNSDFKQSLAKWNMNTGEIKLMKYEHPDIRKKRINFAVSMKKNIYVESHYYIDLLTICNLDGDLKYNIYGDRIKNKQTNKTLYYNDIEFCNDKIIASYSGGDTFTKDENGIKSNYPSKFLIFDIKGNYIKTLEVGYSIVDFCYDKDNNRIIMSLDDEMQFAYLELDDLIDS
jgi:hypothetical protein